LIDSPYGGFATPFSVIIPDISSGGVISNAGFSLYENKTKQSGNNAIFA